MLKNKKQNKQGSLANHNTLVGLSFILPNFIGFTLFILLPVILSLVLAFSQWDGFNEITFVGFNNFVDIFHDRIFKASLWHTAYYSLFTVSLSMIASLTLAIILNNKIKAVNFFRSAMFFPYVASIVAVGAVWNALFMKEAGPINSALQLLGVTNPPGWFASVDWSMPAVIIVSIWKNMGYFMIIYIAALQNIPKSLYEASNIDGANKWQQFSKITFPMLTPAHFFVFMILTINSFKVFDLIFVLTDGGPGIATKVLANYIYDQSFIAWNYGNASAASMVLFLIIGTITLFQFKFEKRFTDFM
jgi:ABC-type sugar transport system permease subunit